MTGHTLTTFVPTGLAVVNLLAPNFAPVAQQGRAWKVVDNSLTQVGVIVEPVLCGIEVKEVAVVWTCGQLDRDGNGYINGDDADYYARCWNLGTAMAEYTGDAWLSGDDMDAFKIDFERGVP